MKFKEPQYHSTKNFLAFIFVLFANLQLSASYLDKSEQHQFQGCSNPTYPKLTNEYASGSMNDYDDWLNIIAANRKSNSRLYISYTLSCINGTSAEKVRPGGATEIWLSYWKVLDKMSSGQTLIILSDFNSRYPLTSRDHVRLTQKAKQRGVKVYAVQL